MKRKILYSIFSGILLLAVGGLFLGFFVSTGTSTYKGSQTFDSWNDAMTFQNKVIQDVHDSGSTLNGISISNQAPYEVWYSINSPDKLAPYGEQFMDNKAAAWNLLGFGLVTCIGTAIIIWYIWKEPKVKSSQI